jgi:hypothetical protein
MLPKEDTPDRILIDLQCDHANVNSKMGYPGNMKLSAEGAMIGALIGAIARSAVVFLHLGGSAPLAFYLPSAAIGILVGFIAGATGNPWRGAVVGALLSGVVFELFMLSCASLIGIISKKHAEDFVWSTAIFALEMGAAGLLAGGIGGWVGYINERSPSRLGEVEGESSHRASKD